MTVFSFLFSHKIAEFLGAQGNLLSLTSDYLRFYILFGIFFCMAMVLAAFVRNDGNPKLGLAGMTAGALSNVFLDWLFIFVLHMGVRGAAIASGLGQVISCMIMLPHFIQGKGRLKLKLLPLKKYYILDTIPWKYRSIRRDSAVDRIRLLPGLQHSPNGEIKSVIFFIIDKKPMESEDSMGFYELL